MATLRQLLALYHANPPTHARTRALRLRAIRAARIGTDRQQLESNRYWKFPELPQVPTTVVRACQLYLNAELRGFNVSGCWALWDQIPTISATTLIEILVNAKKIVGGSHPKPGPAFDAALKALLRESGLVTEEKGPKPVSHPPPRVAKKSDLLEVVVRLPLAQLDTRRQTLITTSASASRVSDTKYLSLLIEETLESGDASSNAILDWLFTLIDADADRTGVADLIERMNVPPIRKTRVPPVRKTRARRRRPDPRPRPTKAEASIGLDKDPSKPPLYERLRIVIGQDSVNIDQAIEKLRVYNPYWVPKSKDLNAYISLALSTHVKDIFERVSRGIYRVRERAPVARNPPKTVKAKSGLSDVMESPFAGAYADDLGNNVMESPFVRAAE